MKEIWTRITIDDNDYAIKKFDAKTGMKLARLVIAKAQPLIPYLESEDDEKSDNGRSLGAVMGILSEMKDEDIDNLVDKCLRACYAVLPAGLQPIIDETGHYGVEDVEYDMILTLRLCYEAIKWGAADFFDGNSSLSNLFRK